MYVSAAVETKFFLPGENEELKQTIKNYELAPQDKDTQVEKYKATFQYQEGEH